MTILCNEMTICFTTQQREIGPTEITTPEDGNGAGVFSDIHECYLDGNFYIRDGRVPISGTGIGRYLAYFKVVVLVINVNTAHRYSRQKKANVE